MEGSVDGWTADGGIGRLGEWAGEGIGLTTAEYHRIPHAIPGCSRIPL